MNTPVESPIGETPTQPRQELCQIVQRFRNRPKTIAGQVFLARVCFTQEFTAALDDKEVDMLGLERGNTLRAYGYFVDIPESRQWGPIQFFATGEICDRVAPIETSRSYSATLQCMFAEDGSAASAPFARYQTTWSGLRIESIDVKVTL